MSYPYTFADIPYLAPNNTSYADIQAVNSLMMSYHIGLDTDEGTARQVHQYLIWVSREIDSVLLKAGIQVPPPATSPLMAILAQTCAIGAAALLAHARFETGDEILGSHASQMSSTYDASMGLLERGDINLLLMGGVSAGWAPTADRRQYYGSGNLEPLSDGTAKVPFVTTTTEW